MASCLITISGTNGELVINYKIAGNPYSIITGKGTLYIEDTATNVTYTTLYGDVTAASSCLTITNVALQCYKVSWTGIKAEGYMFDAVILGQETISINETPFPVSSKEFAESVNSLNDERIKIISYKKINPIPFSIDETEISYNYIVKSSVATPIFRIRNASSTGYIYIYGVSNTCSPTGYIPINTCTPEISPS